MFDSKLYKETFSQVQASGETLSEVLNMSKKNKHNGARTARLVLIAAVVTAMLATTAFAYVGFTQYENPMEMLKTFFGAEEYTLEEGRTFTYQDAYGNEVEADLPDVEKVPVDEKVAEEDVAPYVGAVGQTLTYEDYTLTVSAHLYDSATDCGVIYYTLENPNGVSGYELQSDGEVWWPSGGMIQFLGASGENYIIEDETTDTKLTVAVYYCGADKEEYLTLAFYADTDNQLKLPLDDGGGMDALMLADGNISLSPVAIRITVTDMDYLWLREDGTMSPSIYCNIDRLAIRYKDGTEYVVESDEPYINNTTYVLISFDGSTMSYTFNRLIDIDQVEAVIINDVEYTDIQAMTRSQRDAAPAESAAIPVATEPANP